MRLIKHRDWLVSGLVDLRVPGALSEPSDQEVHLAEEIIEEIQQQEGFPIHQLSEQKATEYTLKLGAAIRARYPTGISRDRALELLATLERPAEPVTGRR